MNRISTHIKQTLKDIYPPNEIKNLMMMIWCDLLDKDALDIYLGKDTNLSTTETLQLENILQRMVQHEPIQYVFGHANFCGRSFQVAPGVLIPRPETEELVELIVNENEVAQPSILDVGTGSGCIAISLSLMLNEAKVTGWDVSELAIAQATSNNDLLKAHVTFEKHDVLKENPTDFSPQFDIIVSNPPYVTLSEKSDMERNVLDWEPHLALFVADDDPLIFYRQIAMLGISLLRIGGKLYFEINRAFGKETIDMLESLGYEHCRIIKDICGNDRMVSASKTR